MRFHNVDLKPQMPQQSAMALVRTGPRRFVVGLIMGSIVGGILIGSLSGTLAPSWLENVILSSMTWTAFAFIIFGYFYRKKGQKTISTDILLGIGIGITLAWFVGAGNGSITLSDITF
jgi:hypothetical protein